MIVLALDSATWTASAAVVRFPDGVAAPGEGEVLAVEDLRTTTHSEVILPLVARVVAAAGVAPTALDAVAVGAGPGSFTGLRIAMATAKGVAFAAGRPLWAVSSLAALALDLAPHTDATLLIPVLDARRSEVFVGAYRRDPRGVIAAGPERVVPPDDVAAMIAALAQPGERAAAAGDALAIYPALLSGLPDVVRVATPITPSAIAIARLAAAGARVDVLGHGAPVYIRPSEAEVKYPHGVPGARGRDAGSA